MSRTTTTCMQCSVGCQMHVDSRVSMVQRTMSVEEDNAISDGWLCDRGRYNVGYVKDDRRLTQPLYRQNGEWVQIGWDDAITLWKTALREGIAESLAGTGTPHKNDVSLPIAALEAFCAELESKLEQARDKVTYSLHFSSTTRLTSRRYAVIAALASV